MVFIKKEILLAVALFFAFVYIDGPHQFSNYVESAFIMTWYALISVLLSITIIHVRRKINEKKSKSGNPAK
jgi:cytochrome oxidase assembly protein ShyY1